VLWFSTGIQTIIQEQTIPLLLPIISSKIKKLQETLLHYKNEKEQAKQSKIPHQKGKGKNIIL
jgi:CHASE3 domain sensor protein